MSVKETYRFQFEIFRLEDADWLKVSTSLKGRAGTQARNSPKGRKFVESVLWVAKARVPWSFSPACYGASHTNYMRFTRWANLGVWQNIAAALQGSDESRLLLELVEHYRQRVSERNEIKLFRKMAIEAEVGEPNLFA